MTTVPASARQDRGGFWARLGAEIWLNRQTYILLIPGLVWYAIFCYGPMGGLQLAFKTFNAKLGIWGSPFVDPWWLNYKFVFMDPEFFRAVKNTIVISLCRILFEFPAPIILALLLNEVTAVRYKKVLQTIYTFPHFLSWIIITGIMFNLFNTDGMINTMLVSLTGGEPYPFLGSLSLARPLLFITSIWKGSGWGSIIYLAAIAGIDQEQYESAMIDGANRFQRMIYITLPGIEPTIIIMLILAFGGIMNAGFDQIFNLTNVAVRSKVDILDTYIYRVTFQAATDFGFSTAISLMKAIVNFTFLMTANFGTKLITGSGLFA